MDYRNLKYRIVKENLDLPANEIKRKLRKYYPDIKNEEVEKLICEVVAKNKNSEKDDYER